jgi:hypothetical protein
VSTPTGTVVTVEESEWGPLVIFTQPVAPGAEFTAQSIEAGRLVEHDGRLGFQPRAFMAGVITAPTMRKIADLIDEREAGVRRCRNCDHPIRVNDGYPAGWEHFPYPADPSKGWQGVRCPRRLTVAVPAEAKR